MTKDYDDHNNIPLGIKSIPKYDTWEFVLLQRRIINYQKTISTESITNENLKTILTNLLVKVISHTTNEYQPKTNEQ